MYDIHSHILFEIDDGAKSADDAVGLCRMAAEDGVERIVATPHIREGVWPNDFERISGRLDDLRTELEKSKIDIDVVLGAELYFNSEMVTGVRQGAFPTYGDQHRYILFELPAFFIPRQVQSIVFDFRTAGITPVLAHPERNGQMMNDLTTLRDLIRMGTVTQVTAMSVTGKFGRKAKKAADTLLDLGLAHVIASDAHHQQHRPTTLSEARKRISRKWGEERAQRLFVDNPKGIIDGVELDTSLPAVDEAPSGFRKMLSRLLGG